MRYKVSWLVFWVSMVLWFGNMFGCAATTTQERQYNVLEPIPRGSPRPRMHDVERSVIVWDVTPEGDHLFTLAVADDAPAPAPTTPAAPGTPTAVDPTTTIPPSTFADPRSDTEPSLRKDSLDRSHWPKSTAGPITGTTVHYPTYFKDCPIYDRGGPAIRWSDPVEAQLHAALSGSEDGCWDCHHWAQVPVQVGKYAFDLVALPVRVFIEPPWTDVTTP